MWAAQGISTGLIVIGSQNPSFDWNLSWRRHRGEWPSQTTPRTAARWSRLRLAPPPGGLWHLRMDADDPRLTEAIDQARRDFYRVVIVDDSEWQLRITQLSAHIDTRILVLGATSYPRSIALPPAPHAPDEPAQMLLSARESALQWRLEHLSKGSSSGSTHDGLLLLHNPFPGREWSTDGFAAEVEEHLALMGAPVLGHFPGRGLVVRGPGHSPHPPTVLDPQVIRTNVLDATPLHNDMEQPVSALAQRLWPAAAVHGTAAAGHRQLLRTLSPFLVAASSGLGEEALAGEASEAAAGDVDGCLVGGHVEEFVQVTGSEDLVGVLVEGVHDGLVGGVRLGRIGLASSGCEFGDDLGGGSQVRESCFGFGQGGGQVLDLIV